MSHPPVTPEVPTEAPATEESAPPAEKVKVSPLIRRVMVVGVSGYLGSAIALGLREEFEVLGSYHQHPVRIEGVTTFPMNCINGGEILDRVKRYKPDVVIYCAGLSESDSNLSPPLAESLHFKAPTVFFKILPMYLRFLLLTPSEVLGDQGLGLGTLTPPFDEKANPLARSSLARSHLQGESVTLGHKRATCVMRHAECYGESLAWNVFSKANYRRPSLHWFEQMQTNLQRGQRVELNPKKTQSYLYVGDLVRAVRAYLNQPHEDTALYHIGGSQGVSQFDLGRLAAEALGYDPALIVPKVGETSDYTLNSQKFQERFSLPLQNPKDGLGELAERLRTGFTKTWSF
ncbi:MAG: NAD-dependent epimerase/dehydratase family protein [Bdellovibrionales bacterium]|nr:NAD-dependent epimerase/dehydratase family protein [Bdellovibrionales bacterium]